MWSRGLLLFWVHIFILHTCFIQFLCAADLRIRNSNNIVPRHLNIKTSANGTDVVDIMNPLQNGNSINKFDHFDVGDGNSVILNNSLQDGVSKTGGFVLHNPNLTSSANLITIEILSGTASKINGSVEVFGKSADLLFANENGFSFNGASFLNTNGLSVVAGKIYGDRASVVGNGKVDILEGGIGIDGNYFNVIARSIRIAGGVSHLNEGEILQNINFIAGLNSVSLEDKSTPKIVSQKLNTTINDNIAISGEKLGSMYGNNITFISTESGVGVRHQGIITGVNDILIMANGDITTNTTLSKNNISLIGNNIETTTSSAKTINIEADFFENNGDSIGEESINLQAENINNNGKMFTKNLKATHTNFKNNGEINAYNIQSSGNLINIGDIVAKDISLYNASNVQNYGNIYSSNSITVNFNKYFTFNNKGKMISQNLMSFNSNGDINIGNNFGTTYSLSDFTISSGGNITLSKSLSNIGSISLKAGNDILLMSTLMLSSANNLDLQGKTITNDSYMYSGGNTLLVAKKITNNGTIDSNNKLYLEADNITNNGFIFANDDIFIETKNLTNNTKLSGDVVAKVGDFINSYGYVDYGDTAFKTWQMNLKYYSSYYENSLNSTQATITSNKNLYVNAISKDKSAKVNNYGVIGANDNVQIFGSVNNVTPTKDKYVVDLLNGMILSEKLIAKEYLGSWNTNESSYYGKGISLLYVLKDLANSNYNNHQKEGIYNAIKDAANKDSNLKLALELLLGSDYANKQFIPPINSWNVDAKIIYTPNYKARILSGKDMKIVGEKFNTGIDSNINKNISIIISQSKPKDYQTEVDNFMAINSQLFNKTDNSKRVTYYIESNNEFIDISKFYGSSYFFSQIGYKPNDIIIGDAYFEHRFLTATLNDSVITQDDIKAMLDNAVKLSENLIVGEELTKEQIENLDQDIIWYVKSSIDGIDVLVPKIYRAKHNDSNLSNQSLASIESGKNLILQADSITSTLSSMLANENVVLDANKDFTSLSSQVLGNDVYITSDSATIDTIMSVGKNGLDAFNKSLIAASGDISVVTKGNLKIKNSSILTNGKNSLINLIAENGSITIENDYKISSIFTQKTDDNSKSITREYSKTNLASDILGANINIVAKENVDITGSNIQAEDKLSIFGGNINILDSINEFSSNTSSTASTINSQGLTEYNKSTSQISGSISNASNISANNIVMNATKDINIRGSNVESASDLILKGNNINITDGRNIIQTSNSTSSLNPFGFKEVLDTASISMASGSKIKSNGSTYIIGNRDVNIIGSDIISQGDTNIFAENIKIAAAKNMIQSQTITNSFGLTSSANAGIAGYGASASFNGGSNNTSTNIFNGNLKDSSNSSLASGAMLSDSIANAEIGFEFSHKKESFNQTFYTQSNIKGNNINIVAKDILDFGGGNFEGNNDINLVGGKIETTKYVDKTETKSDGFSIYVKQSLDTTSNIASLVNQSANNAYNIINGNNLNAGIVAGQAVSNAVNLVLGDLVAETSTQTIGFNFEHSESTYSKENITNIESNNGNVTIKSTNGDMTLNGVVANAKNIMLDSAGKLNINSAKSSYSNKYYSVGAEARIQESAGVSALSGGDTQIGVGGSLSFSYQNGYGTSHTNSVFSAKNDVSIKSSGDTTIVGGNIDGKNINLDVANLNLYSAVDTNYSSGFGIDIGTDASLGVATNTIFTGDVSANMGIMYNESSSNLVNKQSSIVAQNAINGNIKGDVNLGGAIIGSQSKQGNLDIGGSVNTVDLELFDRSDGANINISGGSEGDFGADISIDDHIEKNGTLKSGINITINGKKDYNINDNIENTLIMSDNSWVGGSMNFSADIDTMKNVAGKIKNKLFGSSTNSNQNHTSHDNITLDNSRFTLAKLPNEDSPISQSKQDKIDKIMDNFKAESEFQPPEVKYMVNALQSDKIDDIADAMGSFANPVKDDIIGLVRRDGDVNDQINDVFSVVGLKYFNSNLENQYTSTMNNFYANVASEIFKTSAFQDTPEINNVLDLYNAASNMDICFKNCLKKDFDIDVELSELKEETSSDTVGRFDYQDNVLQLKWGNFDTDEMYDTLFHELTHKVQYALVDNLYTSPNLSAYKNYIDMLKYNFLVYAEGGGSNQSISEIEKYFYQPLELEAYRNGNTFKELYSLSQGYTRDKDNIFDENNIKQSFLKIQKKVNDDGHYSISDTSSESGESDYSDSQDSEYFSPSEFEETLSISYGESPETPNFAPNDNAPLVDRSTKPKTTVPDILPRQPLKIDAKNTTLGDALDLVDFIKTVGKDFKTLNLQEKADLIDFGLLKSSLLNNANSEISYMVKQQATKHIFAQFGDMLVNNDPQVSSYKALLNEVSMNTAEDLAFDSNIKTLAEKDYRILSNLKPLFEQIADKWNNSINNVGIPTKTPLCKNSICADTVSFNHKTNELVIPMTYSSDFSFIADKDKALQSAFEVGFHEFTHQFQSAVIEYKDSLEPAIYNVARILKANSKYYFDGTTEYDISLYKEQALEAEAYDNAKKTLRSFNDAQNGDLETYDVVSWDDLKNGDSYSSSDDD